MSSSKFHLSFEFYPPRTEQGHHSLLRSAQRLIEEKPDFFSVTYGAGGTTRTRTSQAIASLLDKGWNSVPHLSWGDTPASEVVEQVENYRSSGVRGFVLLRGDAPSGTVGGVLHHAVELVGLVRDRFGDAFEIYVAAYPEMHPDASSPSNDIDHLKAKVEAGADACFTQYFFNPDAYKYFVDQCLSERIDVPIIPGIMPITNYERLVDFSTKCGAEVPRWIERKLHELKDDSDALQDFGCEVVQALCQELCDEGCPGLHFYTLNRAKPTLRILNGLTL